MKRLIMALDQTEISYKNSSNLQGVLFEQISREYAEILHLQKRHPYSQYLYKEKEKTLWCVNALDEEAEAEIIEPLNREEFQEFEIKKQGKKVRILEKSLVETTPHQLVKAFYSEPPEHFFEVELLTPTAFKQKGRYVIYPDLRLLYQSLMNKYSAVSSEMEMMDEDTLELLAEKSEIVKYYLRTTAFPLEGIRIPAFWGSFTIKIDGPDTLAAYVRLLLTFGEYAGVGIKTAMGMGAVRLWEGGRKRER
ncbi:MAG: CRISPR-associated endoribonuclease Cas6 [Lachnospiraceae bacterium]|nr:CRISPR-associated endoribonuclease Cas6 [Lachnospiraceae bacterium]